jgi:hypothetical protein
MRELADQRYRDHLQLAKALHRSGRLKPRLSARRAADMISVLANERSYLALVSDRGWPVHDYENWLAGQLIAALLA